MAQGPDESSPLLDAARSFEAELTRFAQLAHGLEKAPLGSEKQLDRAADRLQELAACEERLGVCAQALMQALGRARDEQQAQADAIVRRAQVVRDRQTELGGLLDRYRALAEEAAGLNGKAQDIGPVRRSERPGDDTALLDQLQALATEVARLAEVARSLSQDAHDREFPDLARQVHGLAQQLGSMKDKLGYVQRSISS